MSIRFFASCAAIVLSCACGSDEVTVAAAASASSGNGGASGSSVLSASASTSSSAASSATTGVGAGGGSGGGATDCKRKTGMPGGIDATVVSSGTERVYHVHAPPSYSSAAKSMLVFVFHGFLDTAAEMEAATHMSALADAHGFIVVYPTGLGSSWNAGSCCGTSAIAQTPDVQFVSDMLDQLESTYCIDPKRVFASGFSNGGMLSHRLGCELSERIAAIGAVSGTLAISTCAPTRPLAVAHVHGTADTVVLWDGGGLGGADSVPDTIAGWVARDGCAATTAQVYANGAASCDEHAACAQGSAVRLCTIQNGDHQWPGADATLGIGAINMDLDASEMLVSFFEAHPMP